MYIELHARSAFSFLEGTALPEDLAAFCAALNMPAMALLDRDGVYGAPRFHLAAKKAGVKAHIGAEVNREAFSSGPTRAASARAGTDKFSISNFQLPIESKIPELQISNWQLKIGNFF